MRAWVLLFLWEASLKQFLKWPDSHTHTWDFPGCSYMTRDRWHHCPWRRCLSMTMQSPHIWFSCHLHHGGSPAGSGKLVQKKQTNQFNRHKHCIWIWNRNSIMLDWLLCWLASLLEFVVSVFHSGWPLIYLVSRWAKPTCSIGASVTNSWVWPTFEMIVFEMFEMKLSDHFDHTDTWKRKCTFSVLRFCHTPHHCGGILTVTSVHWGLWVFVYANLS